jgi:hypothetical protein
MFNQCIHGDHSEVARLREKAASRTYQPAGQSANNDEDSDSNDEDDGSEDAEDDAEDEVRFWKYACDIYMCVQLFCTAFLFGFIQDAMDVEETSATPEPQGPIIDEDGFELVTKGRRRR